MKGKMREIFEKPGGLCPFIEAECVREKCMIYHKQFEKCELEVMDYNIYQLGKTMEKMIKAIK